MSNKLLAVIAIFIFMNHLVLTVLINLPINPLSKYYEDYLNRYMAPLFLQNWKLFAPNPPTSYEHFLYRCSHSTKWFEWKDTTEEIVKLHQQNRIAGYGKFLYVQSTISNNLQMDRNKILEYCIDYKNCDSNEDFDLKIQASSSYANAAKFSFDLCLLDYPKNQIDGVQFQVVTRYVKPFSKRKIKNYKPKSVAVLFPPLEL